MKQQVVEVEQPLLVEILILQTIKEEMEGLEHQIILQELQQHLLVVEVVELDFHLPLEVVVVVELAVVELVELQMEVVERREQQTLEVVAVELEQVQLVEAVQV